MLNACFTAFLQTLCNILNDTVLKENYFSVEFEVESKFLLHFSLFLHISVIENAYI